MAEVCSRYPTAGGLYYWAGRLAKTNKRQWAWFVGWFNFLGEVAVTAAIDFGCATTWMAFANLMGWVDEVTPAKIFVTFVVIILAHALLNTFGVNLVGMLSNISAWWHVAGVLVIVAVLWILPDKHQSVSLDADRLPQRDRLDLPAVYVFLMGLLMAQYTFTGYDASAHVSEETKRRLDRRAPRHRDERAGLADRRLHPAVLDHRGHPGRLGGGLTTLAASDTGLPPAQIFLDAMGSRRGEVPAVHRLRRPVLLRHGVGDGQLADGLRLLPRQRAAGLADLGEGQPRTGTPTNSIWLCVRLSIVLACPALLNTTAYLAVTSIAVIGLYIAYVVPVFLRRLSPDFQPGPWNLGRWSR